MNYDPKTGLPGMVRLDPGEMVNGAHVDPNLLAMTAKEKAAATAGASPQERAECDCRTPDVCAVVGCSPGSEPETFDPRPWQDVAMATLTVAGVVAFMIAVGRWIGGAG